MHQLEKLRVIISGGGTGGHVFPAIAIADALKSKVCHAQILFVGAKGKIEMEKVPKAGYHILGLNISGFQRKITYKNLLVIFRLICSMIRARNIVKRFKPDVAIGVGGYASGPILYVAAKRGIPTVIQEQNSYPGITNKLLARKAEKICVAYDGMDKYFPESKIYFTGNPVRNDLIDVSGKSDEAFEFFGLNKKKKVLLVLGGSLGAKTINQSVKASLELFLSNDIQVIWQTGKLFYQEAFDFTKNLEKTGVIVVPFIDRMDLAYGACDMVVSRAGAISVSEICVAQKPAIFIPSPNVAEDHQTKNAKALVNHNGAIMIKDMEAVKNLGQIVLDTIFDEDKKHRLKENIARFSIKDSADRIASVVMSLI